MNNTISLNPKAIPLRQYRQELVMSPIAEALGGVITSVKWGTRRALFLMRTRPYDPNYWWSSTALVVPVDHYESVTVHVTHVSPPYDYEYGNLQIRWDDVCLVEPPNTGWNNKSGAEALKALKYAKLDNASTFPAPALHAPEKAHASLALALLSPAVDVLTSPPVEDALNFLNSVLRSTP